MDEQIHSIEFKRARKRDTNRVNTTKKKRERKKEQMKWN